MHKNLMNKSHQQVGDVVVVVAAAAAAVVVVVATVVVVVVFAAGCWFSSLLLRTGDMVCLIMMLCSQHQKQLVSNSLKAGKFESGAKAVAAVQLFVKMVQNLPTEDRHTRSTRRKLYYR